jgi:hypothetical protein
MNQYKIWIDPEALEDIQKATDWYNEQLPGLGSKFQDRVIHQINLLKTNPLGYSIRYKDVRCCLVKNFPFLIHFKVVENLNLVEVYSLFHTSRNPKIWLKRK